MKSAIARIAEGRSNSAIAWLAALLVVLAIAPWFVSDYLITVLIVIFYLAFTGQAWNIMMGFAGQLSLGHALYAGLGAYITAALFTRYGIAPWVGFLVAAPVAAMCGAIIGFLAFRFGVSGVYFAILTIAFAEFARIGFDHLTVVNASAGLFLPVAQYTHNDLWRLRGHPTMFYYVMLTATAVAFIICNALLRSRMGYFWLAIREDEQAAKHRPRLPSQRASVGKRPVGCLDEIGLDRGPTRRIELSHEDADEFLFGICPGIGVEEPAPRKRAR